MFDEKIEGVVKQYHYRSAQVTEVFMEFPRNVCKDIEERLA